MQSYLEVLNGSLESQALAKNETMLLQDIREEHVGRIPECSWATCSKAK